MSEFTWLPANRAAPEDVEAVFASGGAHRCRCQALKVAGWIWRDTTQEQRDAALVEQTGCGTPGPTSGLIGYVGGEAAGWVSVGLVQVFVEAGYEMVASPTLRRRVVRRRLAGSPPHGPAEGWAAPVVQGGASRVTSRRSSSGTRHSPPRGHPA